MKLNNYILGIGLLASVLFSSCDTEQVGKIYQGENAGLTFTAENQNVQLPAEGYEGFDVELVRGGNIGEGLECPIQVSLLDQDGKPQALPAEFTAPSVVSFAPGEFKTMIHIKVGDIKSGKNFNIAIEFDDVNSGVEAITTKVATVFRDYTYSKIGTGMLDSNLMEDPTEVEILKADDIYWYKVLQMYDTDFDITIQVLEGNKLLVPRQMAFVDPELGDVKIQGSGIMKGKELIINAVFIFSDGGAAGPFSETITLP